MDTEATVEAIDGVVDVASETLAVVRNNPKLLIAAGVAGLVLGAAGGYFFSRTKLRLHYEALAEEDAEQTREYYKNKYEGDLATIEEAVDPARAEMAQQAAVAVRQYSGEAVTPTAAPSEFAAPAVEKDKLTKIEQEAVVVERTSVFATPQVDPGNPVISDAEIAARQPAIPFIVSEEEFLENDWDFDSVIDLTYFAGDNVILDDREEPMAHEEVELVIGGFNLDRFGHGTKDPNTVFVCNLEKEMLFEITRDSRSYAKDVLGFDETAGRGGR